MNPANRIYPDFIEAYLDYTSRHEATTRCHLWSCISILAGALERRVFLDRGYYTLFPNLYTFIIGKSGLIKKSTTTGIAVDLLRELHGVRLMSERVTSASLISQMQKAQSYYYLNDHRVKQAPVYVYASELSVFLEEVYGSILQLLTTFYDCSPHDSKKPWVYDTRTTGTLKIYGPCLNILGASTKAWLKKCLPATEMEGGFTSRVIFVVEDDPPTNLVPWPEMTPTLKLMRDNLVHDLGCIYALVGQMKPTDKAKQFFSEWYGHHMRVVVPKNRDPRFSGYYGRKGDLILKLAMIRSVSLRDSLEITHHDCFWAGQKIESLEPGMRSAFDGGGDLRAQGELSFQVLAAVKERLAVEKDELRGLFPDAAGTEIDRCLQELVDMREVEIFSKGGKFVVKPTRQEVSGLV